MQHHHPTDYIDIYCERLDGSFWAEPINAITNIAFVLAAIYGLYLAIHHKKMTPLTAILIFLTAAIGIGSFLFHTYAQPWAATADVTPIWLFVLTYVIATCERYLHLPPLRSLINIILLLIAIAALTAGLFALPIDLSFMNGSEQYLPALVAIVAFLFILKRADHPATPYIFAVLCIFALSVTFRTLDSHLCHHTPFGTHFLWHSLNGLMFAVLLRGMILHGTDRKT